MYERLKRRFELGQPLVMLHNSGGVTHCFCSLLRALVANPEIEADALLEKLEVPSKKAWASRIGMPEILMMKELQARLALPRMALRCVASPGLALPSLAFPGLASPSLAFSSLAW